MTGTGAQKAVQVIYYLPSKAVKGTGLTYKVPAMMRKHGFVAFDGSCWFGHLDAVAALDFSKVLAIGGRFHVITFVEQQWEEVRAAARLGLERHVEFIRATMEENAVKAEEAFNTANREQSVGGVKKASRFLSNKVRRAKKMMNEALEAALIFDLMGDAASLFDALRTSIAAHEETASTVKAMVKERAKAARKNPNAAWGGHEQVEMDVVPDDAKEVNVSGG